MDRTERLLLTRLAELLAAADGWTVRLDPESEPGRPLSNSVMAADDAAAQPYHISHGTWHNLSVAVDHLSCLRALLVNARVVNMFAPYSLLRSALENASTAVWLLQADTSAERLTRRLRHASGDIRQGDDAFRLTRQVAPRTKEERLRRPWPGR